jgi:hypothetical protein
MTDDGSEIDDADAELTAAVFRDLGDPDHPDQLDEVDELDDEAWLAERRAERRRVMVLTLVGIVVSVVCGVVLWQIRWSQQRIFDVEVHEAGWRLEVSGGRCDAETRTDVDESADRVAILLEDRRPGGDDTCLPSHTVCLSSPLGDRAVIDASTGEPVLVIPVDADEPRIC